VTDPHVRLDVLAATPRIAWIRKPLKLSPRRFRATAACKAERVFGRTPFGLFPDARL
jgi:hypothetical protein